MAATIGSLNVDLSIGTARFKRGLSEAQAGLSRAQKQFAAVGDRMKSVGTAFSIGLTAPLAAFGASSFKAASDAAELQGSFDQTFGKMSKTMNKWAEDTGNAMGRSTQEMQKAANTFGIFFNTAVDPAKAAAMSQTFAKLAQDLGSFYNTDTETAIEKLRSGLSGESEPLRDFGVFLTEANVKAKALELGLTGVGNELTEQEKIVARYNLILEATKNAQGDVARTAGGTANQMRAAKAAFEELQVIVGTKLLPVLTPMITKLAEALKWFSDLPAPVQTAGVAIAGVTAVLGPIAMAVGSLMSAGSLMLPVFVKIGAFFSGTLVPILATVGRALMGLAIAGGPLTLIAAAATAAYLVWQNWDKIGPIVKGMVQTVKTWLMDRLKPIFDWVKGAIQGVANAFKWLDDVVVRHSYIPDMVDSIGDHMRRLQGEMVDPAQKAISDTERAFGNAKFNLPGIDGGDVAVTPAGTTAGTDSGTAETAPTGLAGALQALRGMQDVFGSIGGKAGTAIGGIADILDTVLTPAADRTTGAFDQWGGAIGNAQSALNDLATSIFGGGTFGKIAGALLNVGVGIATKGQGFGGLGGLGGSSTGMSRPSFAMPNMSSYRQPMSTSRFLNPPAGGTTQQRIELAVRVDEGAMFRTTVAEVANQQATAVVIDRQRTAAKAQRNTMGTGRR